MKKLILMTSAALLVAAGSVWPADDTDTDHTMGLYYFGAWANLLQLDGGNDTPAIPPCGRNRNPRDTDSYQVSRNLILVTSGDPDVPISPRHLRDDSNDSRHGEQPPY